ncbi:DUF2892 domain-containing protein [Vicingaceae bacterium]|nr:DUF2892 domain-containing protein [Vicingaceae bacterium]
MKINIGKFDRVIRIILAALISTLYITGVISGTLGLVLLIAGGILLVTVLVNFCPLYSIIGVNSCPKK